MVPLSNWDFLNDVFIPDYTYKIDGEDGTGKSMTMAHLLHYAFEEKYLLVHVPWGKVIYK